MQHDRAEKWEPGPVVGWGMILVTVAFLAGLGIGRSTGGEWALKPGAEIVKYNRHTGQVVFWSLDRQEWVTLGPRE